MLLRIKPNKTVLLLVIASAIGLAAMMLTHRYIRRQIEERTTTAPVVNVQTVVAKTDLARGAVVSAESVALRDVPATWAPSLAVTPDQFERARGMALAHPMKSGEILTWPMLDMVDRNVFSAHVHPGRRAITIAVDEINSISGMVEPGDRIDLLLTLDRGRGRTVVPIVQNVSVMAAGTRLGAAQDGAPRTYSTITLDVSPDEADLIVLAEQQGALAATLRNGKDDVHAPAPTTAALIAMLAGTRGEAGASTVPVLYGGRAVPTDLKPLPPPDARALDRLSEALERVAPAPSPTTHDAPVVPGALTVPSTSTPTSLVPLR